MQRLLENVGPRNHQGPSKRTSADAESTPGKHAPRNRQLGVLGLVRTFGAVFRATAHRTHEDERKQTAPRGGARFLIDLRSPTSLEPPSPPTDDQP
jgi:hypothetical protein